MLNTRELLRDIRITTDDAAAVAENTNDTAVLPVGDPVLVGQFKLTKNVLNIRLGLGLFLQVGDEARPGTTLQLVQQRCLMFCHDFLL